MSARTAMMASFLNRSTGEKFPKHSFKRNRSSVLPYQRHQLLKTKTVLKSLRTICDSDKKRLVQQELSFPCRSNQEKDSCKWYINTSGEEHYQEGLPLNLRVCENSESTNQNKDLDKYLRMKTVISMNNSDDNSDIRNCSVEQVHSACSNDNQEREMSNCSGKGRSDSDQNTQTQSAPSDNHDEQDGVIQQQQSADFKFCIIKILHKFKQIYSEFELNTQHLKEIYFGDELIDREKAEDIVFIFKGIIGKLKIELTKQQDDLTSFYDLWCKNPKLSNMDSDSNKEAEGMLQLSESKMHTYVNDASFNAKQDKYFVEKTKMVDEYNMEAFSTNYQRKTPLQVRIIKPYRKTMPIKVRTISKPVDRNSLSMSPILGASRYINTTESRFKKRPTKKTLNHTGTVNSEKILVSKRMNGATKINVNSRNQRFCTMYKEDTQIQKNFKKPVISFKGSNITIPKNNVEVISSSTQSLENNDRVISDSVGLTEIKEKIHDTNLQRLEDVQHINCKSLTEVHEKIKSDNAFIQKDSIVQLNNKILEKTKDSDVTSCAKETMENGQQQIMQQQPQTYINNESLDNSKTLDSKKIINSVFGCSENVSEAKATLKKDCLYCHDSDIDSTCSSLTLLSMGKGEGLVQTMNHKSEVLNNEIHAMNVNQRAGKLDENALSDSASSSDSRVFSGDSIRLVYEEDDSDKVIDMKRLQFGKTSNKLDGNNLVDCTLSRIISLDKETELQHNATDVCERSREDTDVFRKSNNKKELSMVTGVNGQIIKLNKSKNVFCDKKLQMDCHVLIERLQRQIHHRTRRHIPRISKRRNIQVTNKSGKISIRQCYISLCRTEI